MSGNKNRGSRVRSKNVNQRLTYEWKWRTIIERLSLSRFQWNNLPDTASERYLERCLLLNGQAVFFEWFTGALMATEVVDSGEWNVYHDAISMMALGDGGFTYNIPKGKGVKIYDSLSRKNNWPIFETYISKLAAIDMQEDTNLYHQKNLAMLQGNEEASADLNRLKASLENDDWVILGLKGMTDNAEIKVLNTNIPYLQDKFSEHRTSVLNQVYSYLGIEHLPFEKTERMITAEATVATDSVARMREDAIIPRQQAAEEINKTFGTNITVEWRTSQKELLEESYGEGEEK